MKKISKYKSKSKINPIFITSGLLGLPQNPKKAFELGLIFGEKFIYELVKNDNPLDGDQNDIRQATLFLKNILNQQEMIEAVKTNKNVNTNISKLNPDHAFELGSLLGKKKAIEFVFKNNFHKKLILDQWFILADKIENFE